MNRSGRPTFLDVYPVNEKLTTNVDSERALFVHIGGGYGTQAIAFQKQYPDLPGKVMIEDLPETVKQRAQHPVAQDFFQPQTVKGILLPHPLSVSIVLIYEARCQVLLHAQHHARLAR